MTPSLSYFFKPDFSDSNYGGRKYFQELDNGEYFDYFKTISLTIWGVYVDYCGIIC